MHDEPKFKLEFKIRLKLEPDFYFFKCLRATLGAKSSLMVHDEPELKLGFEIGPEFEPIYLFIYFGFFFASAFELLLTPQVVRHRMANLSSSSSPILDPNLKLGLFFPFF
jgi:hypothetical protein